MVSMMWFKRDPKVPEKVENGLNKLRKKKQSALQPTRESSERETSTESDKERRRYSDILDIRVSMERRDESDESLYESADCQSDVISASDDALPRLSQAHTMSKESLKLAVTDEEVEIRSKKGHRKTMSLSNPLEIVKTLGDEWFDHKKEVDKNCDRKKSRESLWSEEDSVHGSNVKLDLKKSSKKDDKNEAKDAKRKSSKGSSVGSFNFLRRKKTPTSMKPVEAVVEVDGAVNANEIMNHTKLFLEEEKRVAALSVYVPPVETDSDEEVPTKRAIGERRRRLSRQASRSKSKVRGKSQTVRVNTLRKSHSGTLKKAKKKSVKAPMNRSRQASIAEPSPIVKKKNSDSFKQNSWLFSASRGESRREGSTEEQSAPDVDNDASENNAKEVTEKENNSWRSGGAGAGAASRGVYRAESCRERDAPRRGKHRNASDPNRLTAHPSHDLEPGAATAPSGSSSSSSLSSRSNESNTVAAEQQDWSEEEEPLAAQWADSLPPAVRDSVLLCARLRKRQEVIHELIVSEGSHVRWLKVLGGDFLRPLERQPALLPAEELRALFPNLPAVRERHARLYAELRAARAAAPRLLVPVRAVADVLLSTLGEPGYAGCLARFCRGQRMALEALRERRRKNKELHQFLAGREQLPRCGRLQLRDLLACVWQRLTKYQLLLESILKTVVEEEVTPEAAAAGAAAAGADGESAEDIAQLRRALATAKEVLHTVDTAIRTAENEHRLKTIQSKLEVRAPVGGEWEELRRLDLTAHALRMEGELLLRTDAKKCGVRALMLEDSLVLLQREADRFLLKPIAQPSQNTLLSPLIKWDKVLFRPNAAMRNTFFLMNINGIQMHELSANTAAEYATWVRLIQESPLARLAETKSAAHQHTRSADDSGINVSRNPSDASEKSTSSAPPDDAGDSDREKLDKLDKLDKMDKSDKEAEKESQERSSLEREKASMEGEEVKGERERSASEDKDDSEDKHRRRATVGRITTHIPEPDGEALEESDALVIRPPLRDVPTAQRVLSHSERLRRLDAAIARALSAKSAVVGELLGLPPRAFAHLAELAVADTLGHDDLSGDLRPNEMSVESEPDIHQLLLAAQAQANQLTEMLSSALSISEATAMRVRSGRCDSCRARDARFNSSEAPDTSMSMDEIADGEFPRENNKLNQSQSQPQSQSLDASFDMLPDASQEIQEPDIDSYLAADGAGAAALAARLAGVSGGLQAALGRLVAALPALHAQRAALRHELALSREREQRARADKRMTEEMSILKDGVDQSIQDQPSNGG
ncbi:uncharacterized protein LOC119836103 isoform X7 [Zerene cesonia]|uniref:uncharacterized protein LOC119836103 isoform X7 n=1 Tax=Zerene cesonia TaxID=33412 RepID=UPI0018E539E4|nr:uncharacterized protein LOC119836103 isoform X7 [Zerene cesonia]